MTTRLRAAGSALAALGGVALAVQGRVNGQLGHQIHDGIAAALISFGIGSVILVAALPVLPSARAGITKLRAALRSHQLRPWQLLGGACGALLIAAQGLTITILGVAVFTVAVVAGQVVSSLPVDRAGLGPGGPQPITVNRAAGAALAIVAVVVAVSDHAGITDPGGLWWALLPALGGLSLSWQLAMNGRVRMAADNVVIPTLVNFLVGTAALVLAALVSVVSRGWPDAVPTTLPGDWWLYLGGPLGVGAIMTAVTAVRLTGVLVLGLSSVAGQLVGAVLLDLVVPTGGGLSATSVIGAAITMLAVGVAAIRR